MIFSVVGRALRLEAQGAMRLGLLGERLVLGQLGLQTEQALRLVLDLALQTPVVLFGACIHGHGAGRATRAGRAGSRMQHGRRVAFLTSTAARTQLDLPTRDVDLL